MSVHQESCGGVSGWVVERVVRQGIVPIRIPQCICMNRKSVDKYFDTYRAQGYEIRVEEQEGCNCQTRIIAEKGSSRLIASIVPVA